MSLKQYGLATIHCIWNKQKGNEPLFLELSIAL